MQALNFWFSCFYFALPELQKCVQSPICTYHLQSIFLTLFKTFFYLPFNYLGSPSQILSIILSFTRCFDWSECFEFSLHTSFCVWEIHHVYLTDKKYYSISLSTSDVSLYIILYHRKFHYGFHFPLFIHIFFLFRSLFKFIFKISKFFSFIWNINPFTSLCGSNNY